MKTLIVFYSRTGTNKKVAEALAQKLNADLEEIQSAKHYSGPIGYLIAGREAMKKIPAKIKALAKNPAEYDLVILGTPIWSFKMSSPVRAYLIEQKDKIKKAAFFCVRGGSDAQPTFDEIAELIGQNPTASLALLTKEVAGNNFEEKLKDFAEKLIS